MRNKILALFAALVAAFALTGSLAASAASAAPGEVTAAAFLTQLEKRDTDYCNPSCYIPDQGDDTYFEHDAGGVAVKLSVFTPGGTLAGKVEFHPLGEHLYVYDTLSDGVSIKGVVAGRTFSSNGGTSYNLSYGEGADLYVELVASNGTRVGGWGTA